MKNCPEREVFFQSREERDETLAFIDTLLNTERENKRMIKHGVRIRAIVMDCPILRDGGEFER